MSTPLLNRIPALDKGYVAFVSAHNNGETLKTLSIMPSKSNIENFGRLARLTLAIKCPIFLQLNLGKHNLRLSYMMSTSKVEAFIPDLTDIGSSDRETNSLIADDISRTSEALLINPKAYQEDGCDKFISQVLTPISVYNELIVDGELVEWIKFVEQQNSPKPIQAYQDAVRNIINNEWKLLNI